MMAGYTHVQNVKANRRYDEVLQIFANKPHDNFKSVKYFATIFRFYFSFSKQDLHILTANVCYGYVTPPEDKCCREFVGYMLLSFEVRTFNHKHKFFI